MHRLLKNDIYPPNLYSGGDNMLLIGTITVSPFAILQYSDIEN